MGGDNQEGGMPSAPSFEVVQGYGEISFSDGKYEFQRMFAAL